MKELIEKLKRDIRKIKDIGPFCSDAGINALMDVHDELLRTARKLEEAARKSESARAGMGSDGAEQRASISRNSSIRG